MVRKPKTRWFDERLYPHVRQGLSISKILFRERTAHQDLIVFENPTYGRVLALDGIVQVTQKDEYVYHEMMTHVPILAHGRARRVLIVGGGDGGILREVLRHKSVTHVTMVEIDRAVVDMCLKWMPSVAGKSFADRRTNLLIADGAKFVAETRERFDVIIVDSTDPIGPGEVLFTERFYRDCKRCLTAGGILVNQNGVPFLQPGEVPMTRKRRGKSFAAASFYMAAVPSYYGGLMALGWATDDRKATDVSLATLRRRFAAARIKTRYYSPEIHRGCFALPAFVAALAAR
ncbi:MAG: polyamine aminopropyltransferase [Rhodospirillales bacterium]|nr:polyamine aminopropyltransferase [Rhodospirillales bacterium]